MTGHRPVQHRSPTYSSDHLPLTTDKTTIKVGNICTVDRLFFIRNASVLPPGGHQSNCGGRYARASTGSADTGKTYGAQRPGVSSYRQLQQPQQQQRRRLSLRPPLVEVRFEEQPINASYPPRSNTSPGRGGLLPPSSAARVGDRGEVNLSIRMHVQPR